VNDVPGPMPRPTSEEPELSPGGADAIDDHRFAAIPETPIGADIPPAHNPASADAPEEISQPDDKQQEPDADSGDPDAEVEQPG
jgi:hypothetical protein